MISQQIVMALRRKYEADIDCARTNVSVYLNHPAGVAEHPDIVSAVDTQIQIIAEARDKLQEIEEMEMNQIHQMTTQDIINV
tara:strand:+ start:3511 stop:3756 length:246 start_codon:yes stop_codon:yes gene_type:complete